MEKKLLLLLNPCAGQRKANRLLPEIIRLFNDRGYECVTYVTAGPGDATPYVKENAHKFERIVCIGGDGTLNETIAGLVEGGAICPVGYIPAGTTNDYASSLGISPDILEAAAAAVDGEPCYFDLGSFNGRQFIYTASCGAFARSSYTTSQAAKNLLGHVAYVLEGLRDIPSLKPIHMKVSCDGKELEDDYIFCAVTNSLSVGGILKLDPDMVRLNDGMFEVMLIKYPTQPSHLTKILIALRSNDLPSEMIEFFTADRLSIEVADDVEWTLDGERGECGHSFDIVNYYKRIRLVLQKGAEKMVPVIEDNLPALVDLDIDVIEKENDED